MAHPCDYFINLPKMNLDNMTITTNGLAIHLTLKNIRPREVVRNTAPVATGEKICKDTPQSRIVTLNDSPMGKPDMDIVKKCNNLPLNWYGIRNLNKLNDVAQSELEPYFEKAAKIDPGNIKVYQAKVGDLFVFMTSKRLHHLYGSTNFKIFDKDSKNHIKTEMAELSETNTFLKYLLVYNKHHEVIRNCFLRDKGRKKAKFRMQTRKAKTRVAIKVELFTGVMGPTNFKSNDLLRQSKPVRCPDHLEVVIFWGNGIFGNSKGHCPVPNVELVRYLSKFTLVVLVNEMCTSKLCSRCKAVLPKSMIKYRGQRLRKCTYCRHCHDRDYNGVENIEQSAEYVIKVNCKLI